MESLTAAWSSPSNIALVKYWGKRPVQLPASPSVSFTLDEARTFTKVTFRPGPETGFFLRVNGEQSEIFDAKMRTFFEKLHDEIDLVDFGFFEIESRNTFPHSSGIASSASGLSAMALCLCSIEAKMNGREEDDSFFMKASRLARLGSGSACRSVYGPLAAWGTHLDQPGSHDEYAIRLDGQHVDPIFLDFYDSILILSSKSKSVSSTIGHSLMNDHPYLQGRLAQAEGNMSEMLRVLKEGDLNGFIHVVEEEALSLHALMMSSDPGFILLEPGTVEVINKIRNFREQKGCHLCFTLDAGPNIHLLYPAAERDIVLDFIKSELVPYCENQYWIDDRVGKGPKRMEIL